MRFNMIGAFIRNFPFGTEIAFAKGLRRLGHQVTTVDPSYPDQKWDFDADATILFKWLEGEENIRNLETCKGKKIVYQPDDARFPHIRQMLVEMRKYCDYALTFDRNAAEVVAPEIGYLKSQRLLLTADDELYRRVPGLPRDIDFCFIGSLSGAGGPHASRIKMIDVLQRNGFSVLAGELYDITQIVHIYNRSKVVLNHATDVGQDFGTGYGYQCRHFEAGLCGTAVLSNRVLEDKELHWLLEFDSEQKLLDCAAWILRGHEWVYRGDGLYDELHRSHLPQHRGLEIVNFVESL